MPRRLSIGIASILLGVALAAPSVALAADADAAGALAGENAAAESSAAQVARSGEAAEAPGDGEGGAEAAPEASSAEVAAGATVSAEGEAAAIDGCGFAAREFYRAQKGSNRDVDGTYAGYSYLMAGSDDYASVVATSDAVVVFVPRAVCDELGIDISDDRTQGWLKGLVIALDAANAGGYDSVADDVLWYFSSEPAVELSGVRYLFNRELKSGSFYTSAIGADGSDITANADFAGALPTHVDAFRLAPSDEVALAQKATGLAAVGEFLANVDPSPLWVTLKTTGVAIAITFFLGLAAAWWSLRIPTRAQDIADTVFTIPMVLPPTVCGFILLLALGNNSPVGQWFIEIGFPLIFSWPATVIAATVVSFPLMYRSARGAFESLDPNMLDAARTLGWGEGRIFFRLMLPLAWSSIAAGTVLAYARALGEFGATLFMAGNYVGVTRTIPLAIYFEWMSGNTDVAIFWTVVVLAFSFVVILFINLWSRHTTKYRKKGAGS